MAPSEDVILYTSKITPYGQRVHVALVEKGIAFKPVFIDYDAKPAGLLEANPIYGKVPTLVHGGNPVCESLVILEYLEEAWPETPLLMPKDCLAKSKVRFWTDFMYKGFENMQKLPRSMADTPEREAAAAEVPKFLKTLEETMIQYSAEGPFFTGDKFGYLDVILSPLIIWTHLLDEIHASIPSREQLPRLHKWIVAAGAHKACREGVPPKEELIAFHYHMVEKYSKAAAEAAQGK